MKNKVTNIKSKTQRGFMSDNPWHEIFMSLNDFDCPLSDKYTRKEMSSVDHSYIESLLAVDKILKKQRKEMNSKIKEIKETLIKIEESRNGKR
jgi:hypothetical protein|tara:strand:+ start:189 stop:467 length:279 start_codon:yes stop_codon:yes gene_type:complete